MTLDILYFAWLRERVDELDPDLLVVNFGLNDVLREGTEYRYDPDRYDRLGYDAAELRKQASRSAQVEPVPRII